MMKTAMRWVITKRMKLLVKLTDLNKEHLNIGLVAKKKCLH